MLDFDFVFLSVDYCYCSKYCHCYWRKTKISYTRKLHLPSNNSSGFTGLGADNNECLEDKECKYKVTQKTFLYLFSMKNYLLYKAQAFQKNISIENSMPQFSMLMLLRAVE